jgi:Protein of unknown function (DUF669)
MADENKAADPDYSACVFEGGDGVVVDLTSVAEAKFENVPKGIYDFEIDSVEYKKSQQGSPMLETWMRVTGPEGNGAIGRKLPHYLVFSAKALPFTKAAINRIEDGPAIFGGKVNLQQIADSGALLGKKARARVSIREYEGQDRSNISQFLPIQVATEVGQATAKFA